MDKATKQKIIEASVEVLEESKEQEIRDDERKKVEKEHEEWGYFIFISVLKIIVVLGGIFVLADIIGWWRYGIFEPSLITKILLYIIGVSVLGGLLDLIYKFFWPYTWKDNDNN